MFVSPYSLTNCVEFLSDIFTIFSRTSCIWRALTARYACFRRANSSWLADWRGGDVATTFLSYENRPLENSTNPT